MNNCDENIDRDHDAIDKYLDIVTGRLDGSLTAAGISKNLNRIYGVEVSLEDAERVREAAVLQFKTGSEIARRMLTETRSEMEDHLRKHVAQLRLDGMLEDDAIVQALKRFGDPNKLREKVMQSVFKECNKARSYKFDPRSCFGPGTLLYGLSFMSAVFLGSYAAGYQLTNSGMNLWGLVPFVFGIGAGIAQGLSAPMGRYIREVASVIDGKSASSTLSQRYRYFMIRLMYRPYALSGVLPLYILMSLLIIAVGSMSLSIGLRAAFGMGCHLMGLCWGRYLESLNNSLHASR